MHLVTKLGLIIFVDGGQPTYVTKLGEKKTFAFVLTKIIHLKHFSLKNWRQALEEIS
jgi:hypothetical protein